MSVYAAALQVVTKHASERLRENDAETRLSRVTAGFMKTCTFSRARQRLAEVLEEASREGEVQIRRQDGRVYAVTPVANVRNYDAHAGQALWREATERLKKFQAAPEAQRRKTFNTAVDLVGKVVQIGSLTTLLEKFYPQASTEGAA